MNALSSDAAGSAEYTRTWVESMGGPLVVVPLSALAEWGGCTESGMLVGGTDTPDDYDRACEVEGLAEAVAMRGEGAEALILGDEPATTCYLPEHRAFLRWLAASSEAELVAAAERVLTSPAIAWEDCGTWTTNGPAVLMDSVSAGADLDVEYPGGGLPDSASVPLPAGTWKVRAVHTEADEHTWVGLVQLLHTEP
ncbi:Imm21 family immunity protein [Streptomyces sp. NPDC013178]|uniref:Imm21 family immunity protein n=1 Tax=Streptomyces sp. NPDC013178 TaxID=3155118 RepID=UPI0033E8D4C6